MPERNVRAPQWAPTQRELDDLDLLVKGCFEPPLSGFVDPRSAGEAAPITLVVPKSVADVAAGVQALDLLDPEGAPLARLSVEGTWPAEQDQVGLVGPVYALGTNDFGPFRRMHRSPEEVHADFAADSLLAVPVARPLSEADLAQVREAVRADGRQPLLLALVGVGTSRQVSGPALVRATLAAARHLQDDPEAPGGVPVVAASVADHGSSSANRWLTRSVASAYATRIEELPQTATGPFAAEIASIVAKDRPSRNRQGAVIFFTGLSGSGKSTLARALVDHVLEQGERTVTSLDGDVVRHHLSKGLGFSRADRETNILRIGFVAAEISRHGGLAVCSPIAPFAATRDAVKEMVEHAGGGFVLIHVSTPLAECERRDRKGLYAKARAGEIADFTGISSPYEEPADAVKIDTTDRDIAQSLEELLQALTAAGWLTR